MSIVLSSNLDNNPPAQKDGKLLKIKPDMLDINTLYSITINGNDNRQQHPSHSPLEWRDMGDRSRKVIQNLERVLKKMSFSYKLYLEYSSPKDSSKNKYPRLHAHGVMYFRSYNSLFRWYNECHLQLQKEYYFDIDTIDSLETWRKYCTKNTPLMMNMFKKHELSYVLENGISKDVEKNFSTSPRICTSNLNKKKVK